MSEEHCALFDTFVAKWQRLLNLSDWRIEPAGRTKSAMADVGFDDEARLATYRVGETFGAALVNADTLERTALHELLHVFLRDLMQNPDDATEHKIINVLEKLLMEGPRA